MPSACKTPSHQATMESGALTPSPSCSRFRLTPRQAATAPYSPSSPTKPTSISLHLGAFFRLVDKPEREYMRRTVAWKFQLDSKDHAKDAVDRELRLLLGMSIAEEENYMMMMMTRKTSAGCKLANFVKPIAKEQEEIIRTHLQHITDDKDDEEEDTEAPLAQPIASSSQQHTPTPSQSPAPKREPIPPTPPQPSPQGTAPQFPYSNTDPPSPHRSQSPSDPGSPGALISDSNDNDEMSKAGKAFDKVTTLKSDGSNWDTWKTQVEFAARSIGYQHYFEWNPQPDLAQGSDDEHRGQDSSDLLNAIIGRLSDGIFRRYRRYNNTKQLLENLLADYNSKNALTGSFLQRRLHTMQCTDPSKVNKHLDDMINICNNLTTRGININNNISVNTIMSSVPNTFKATINTLAVFSAKTDKKLSRAELISTICAESMVHQMQHDHKDESANYAGNRGRGGFRGCGNSFRGNS
ncbi:hypothetical protein BT96DRAFT_1005302 [Gymnopus androsaceus JB14]|uniref:Uncharacterized protein n=1 Tax=Gymnopus androsaceus JB14 TaxID=1447944 RepID=A0A6A4GNT6_9AGAR|nr:hypothetical protein BT96DRAFT_1005302 [Gymnopus androsaceus JB14]